MIANTDYVARKIGKGGSPKGTDKRRCPRKMKYFAWEWAVEHIAHGHEDYFLHAPVHGGRFTAKAYRDLVPLLWAKSPAECLQYFGGREENAAYLISQRVNKMYYVNKNGLKIRAISDEHPSRWPKDWDKNG